MWSFSEEIQMRTHSKTTRCQIQGTEVDALCDLVASASFSPKPFAFTFLGEEPLALTISSWAIPEGIEILQKGVTQSKQEFLFWHLEEVMSLLPSLLTFLLRNDHHLPRQSLTLVPLDLKLLSWYSLKNLRAIDNWNNLIWCLLRTRSFSSHESVILRNFHHNSHESTDLSTPCVRTLQKVLHRSWYLVHNAPYERM